MLESLGAFQMDMDRHHGSSHVLHTGSAEDGGMSRRMPHQWIRRRVLPDGQMQVHYEPGISVRNRTKDQNTTPTEVMGST